MWMPQISIVEMTAMWEAQTVIEVAIQITKLITETMATKIK